MKILMVAIPNHHFFKWVEQLKDSGQDVFWFDITDGGPIAERISWVKQYKSWKLKWDFPLRSKMKQYLPSVYNVVQKYNERKPNIVFKNIINAIQPDVIHCFEMKRSGFPILKTLQNHPEIPVIYSSWGSDMFYFEEVGTTKQQVAQFLKRANYLITDCKRDFTLAKANGFNNAFLGVFPGNGGLSINNRHIKPTNERKIVTIKGYDDGVGKAIKVLQAIECIDEAKSQDYEFVIYSADANVETYVKASTILSKYNIKTYLRTQFVSNESLLEVMGNSCIHIANSISDGMPNALLEAMAMGSFPIQSNPGNVTEEVITNGKNGFLIENPLDANEIKTHILKAIENCELREEAQEYNVSFMDKNYNRSTLQAQIVQLYTKALG